MATSKERVAAKVPQRKAVTKRAARAPGAEQPLKPLGHAPSSDKIKKPKLVRDKR